MRYLWDVTTELPANEFQATSRSTIRQRNNVSDLRCERHNVLVGDEEHDSWWIALKRVQPELAGRESKCQNSHSRMASNTKRHDVQPDRFSVPVLRKLQRDQRRLEHILLFSSGRF